MKRLQFKATAVVEFRDYYLADIHTIESNIVSDELRQKLTDRFVGFRVRVEGKTIDPEVTVVAVRHGFGTGFIQIDGLEESEIEAKIQATLKEFDIAEAKELASIPKNKKLVREAMGLKSSAMTNYISELTDSGFLIEKEDGLLGINSIIIPQEGEQEYYFKHVLITQEN